MIESACVPIGKVVRSESHVRYICQVYGPGEVGDPPEPADYAFGSFVRMPLRVSHARADVALLAPVALETRGAPVSDALQSLSPRGDAAAQTPVMSWAIGLIYDTVLVNPAFGTLGPRLSNDEQVALFSPDYVAECAVLVSIVLLGVMLDRPGASPRVRHGIPPLAPDLGAVVTALSEPEICAFHLYADDGPPGTVRPSLHMGYLPHVIAQDSPLLPMAMLRTIERLELLFPQSAALLAIVKRNFAWRLKVQSAG